MHEFVDISLIGCSKQIEGSRSVALEEWCRIGDASVDMSLRCKIHHYPSIFYNLASECVVGNVAFHESITGIPLEFSNVSRVASKSHEVYICDSKIWMGLNHMMDKVAPDEPETTRYDQVFHFRHLPATV